MASSDPQLVGVYETVLYASDVAAAARFYSRGCGSCACLRSPTSSGPGHVAFAMGAGRLEASPVELRRRGVEIEREITWDEGGRSLYVRDPAGNSVELIEGEAWPTSPRDAAS